MASLLEAEQPVDELGDPRTSAVLQPARELLLGERDGDLLVRHGVAERELQRRNRVCIRIGLAGEEGDHARALFKWEEGTD